MATGVVLLEFTVMVGIVLIAVLGAFWAMHFFSPWDTAERSRSRTYTKRLSGPGGHRDLPERGFERKVGLHS